jgi:hypothetical protein
VWQFPKLLIDRHHEWKLLFEGRSDPLRSISAGTIELWGKLHQAQLGMRDAVSGVKSDVICSTNNILEQPINTTLIRHKGSQSAILIA